MNKSPNLVCRNRSSLLIVDIQEKLIPVIDGAEDIVRNANRLARAAEMFEIPILVSEQYPQGLGATVPELSEQFDSNVTVFEKTTFSCRERSDVFDGLLQSGRDQIIMAGIESHVCVLQTTLDLIDSGFLVYVVFDAVGSRENVNKELALQRMGKCGASLLPTESVLFECCEESTHKNFKSISRLVR